MYVQKNKDLPELKVNKAQGKILYYFAFYTDSIEECEKYFKYLREFEEVTSEKELSTVQVQIFAPKNFPSVVSLLSSCFILRDDEYKDFKWHNFTKANNSHHMVLLRSPVLPDVDDFVDQISDTKLIDDCENYLILNYNFSINS